MNALVSVVETPAYLSKAGRIMTEAEMISIVDLIAQDPSVGVVIRGTGGLRKIRVPLEGRGKRGGARVIYWFHSPRWPAVLLWAFAKNDASDLSGRQRKQLAQAAMLLLKDFGDR